MKIRSLLLGSVAAAGLSTGAYAADLGVLTSLDVCDALGLSGLTISSDTNCLQITGSITYEFRYGDYEGDSRQADLNALPPFGIGGTPNWVNVQGPLNDTIASLNSGYDAFTIPTAGGAFDVAGVAFTDRTQDWYSKVEAWIKFVATADSDFGPAKAVIKIKDLQEWKTVNERYIAGSVHGAPQGIQAPMGAVGPFVATTANTVIGVPGTGGDHTFGAVFDEAYVAVGDSTILMAGKKGTIMNFGDDVPLNFTGLFHSEKVDVGVKWRKDAIRDGGHVIQIVSDLGNGVSVGGGLEKLDSGNQASAGSAVGVLAYAGDGIAAHLTVAADGILTGTVESWGFHAGVSGSFDAIKFVAALAGDTTGGTTFLNGLASVAATFDMFTIAASGEFATVGADTDFGFGGSVSAGVTDGITINVGGRWFRDSSAGDDNAQLAAQLVAAVTESITLTGEVGLYFDTVPGVTVYYGAGQVAWAPGGNFTSSLKGEVYSNGAYKATFKAAKTFE